MIKRLRVKFICVVMAIMMLMLGGILGVVIHFTRVNMEAQSISMMREIASGPMKPDHFGRPSEEMRLPFFAVKIGSSGEVLATGGEFFDLSDGEYVQQIVHAALDANRETGMLEEYHLRYLVSHSPGGYTVVFTDTTAQTATLQHLFSLCLLIFFAAALVFLGISILLSHWVIRPVAAAWDQQRQFVADASHELKTPLSVIMANAELLQSEDSGEEDRKQFSANILTMSYQMRTLVENLLEMARIDNGLLKQQFTDVDFSQLVCDAVLSVQLLYEEQGLKLESSLSEGIFVHGSEQQLFQLLDVLLDNARKYSVPQGVVRVELIRSGRSCLLSVSNPGETIPKEDLKHIFKRFYRADKARAMNGSYGLGLAIADSVVEAHKGKIWAKSEAGQNTFFVQLPTVR